VREHRPLTALKEVFLPLMGKRGVFGERSRQIGRSEKSSLFCTSVRKEGECREKKEGKPPALRPFEEEGKPPKRKGKRK